MADQVLRLILTGDSTKATSEMRKMQRELKKSGQALTSFGTKGMIGGTLVLGGLVLAAKAAGDARLQHVKLENTLRNMPKLAGANIAVFEEQAAALQRLTAADGDEIIAGQAMLGTFQVTKEQLLDIMPVVVDYARKFGVDIPTSAKQVGKALDGQVGALKKNGVSIDEVLFKTDRYRAVSEALQRQVGGFAKDEMVTFPAQLEATKNSLMDVAEAAGGPAANAMSDMLAEVRPLLIGMTSWMEANPKLAGQLIGVTAKAAAGAIAIGAVAFAVGKTEIAIASALPKIRSLTLFFAAGGLATAATEASVAVGLLIGGGSFGGVIGLGGAAATTALAIEGLGVALGVGLGVAVNAGLQQIDGYQQGWNNLFDTMDRALGMENELSFFQKMMIDTSGSAVAVTAAEREKMVADGLITQSTNGAAIAAEGLSSATDETTRAMNGQQVAIDSLAGKQRTFKELQLDASDAAYAVKDAQNAYNAAVKKGGTDSDAAKRAMNNLERAKMRSSDASADLIAKEKEYGQTAKDVAKSVALEKRLAAQRAAAQRLADQLARVVSNLRTANAIKASGKGYQLNGGITEAAGDILPATRGGINVIAAEAGYDEAFIPINNKPRSYRLLAEANRRMGVGGSGQRIVNVYGNDDPDATEHAVNRALFAPYPAASL